ncbi:hypothetical protein SAMN05216272_111159 [Pseudomonas panipatensis]|uniref:Uncharacterized protein n=1 Tax=Pseudomonas panipatensis TaxID=428992 RepID=A0A1G8LHK4_9PSED|nr:hypothetical protein SAMN05216272_111159 [Pseudomonas panipatensis]SMP74891.1 hypothetical protein SAMN06295951_11341 [Pseudomonas panipatensis]
MSGYQLITRCRECDAHCDSESHNSSFCNSWPELSTCHNCGSTQSYYDSIERWVSLSTWWKPWTWRDGHWEKKEGDGHA